MGTAVDYSPQQVTTALMQLVADGGNATKTADAPIDGELIPVATLRRWKNETHHEQYKRLELRFGQELEQQAIDLARQNAVRAAEVERELIERTSAIKSHDTVPNALRAIADSKAKNIDKVLALTGRPVAPRDPGGGGILGLLESMASKGYLQLNVPVVQGSAEEEK